MHTPNWIPFVVATLLVVAPASAQESANSISITGRGKVKVAPTSVELSGMIAVEAELAGDALTKFRTAKQSVNDLVPKLGISELTVEIGGFAIGPAGMNDSTTQLILNRSRGTAPEPPKVLVQELVRLRLKQIDKMERDKLLDAIVKIIDAAKEAGVTFGPPPGSGRISISREENLSFATFIIDDPQSAREKAEAQAFQDATARGDRLAKLANCRLGEVRSVREVQRSSDILPTSIRTLTPEQSSKLDDVEITATVQVDFRLLAK